MLEFTKLVQALDDSVSDDTETVILITATDEVVTVRGFGLTEAVIDALDHARRSITSTHRPRDRRPN